MQIYQLFELKLSCWKMSNSWSFQNPCFPHDKFLSHKQHTLRHQNWSRECPVQSFLCICETLILAGLSSLFDLLVLIILLIIFNQVVMAQLVLKHAEIPTTPDLSPGVAKKHKCYSPAWFHTVWRDVDLPNPDAWNSGKMQSQVGWRFKPKNLGFCSLGMCFDSKLLGLCDK